MFNFKIRTLQLTNTLLAIYGIAWAIAYDQSYLVIGAVTTIIFGMFGANIGMHRLIAHKSFKTNIIYEALLSILATLTTMGTTLGWSGLHRYHHAHSDKANDPHSPEHIGKFKAWIGFWRPTVIPPRIVGDLIHSPLHRLLHKHYFKVIGVYVFTLILINYKLVIFCYCLPASYCLQGSSVVTVLCHKFGYRNHDTKDFSYNNVFAWIISLGEGWHNNHHAHPKKIYQGEKWWEFDINGLVIKYLLKS